MINLILNHDSACLESRLVLVWVVTKYFGQDFETLEPSHVTHLAHEAVELRIVPALRGSQHTNFIRLAGLIATVNDPDKTTNTCMCRGAKMVRVELKI